MQKNKIIIFSLLGLMLLSVTYGGMRYWETRRVDREIDSFFAVYRNDQAKGLDFQHTHQSQAVITDILNRHQSAMHNFQFEDHTPSLNFRLNQTRVEVSWHLSINFEKHREHWHPVLFDEFITEENKKHNQGVDFTW